MSKADGKVFAADCIRRSRLRKVSTVCCRCLVLAFSGGTVHLFAADLLALLSTRPVWLTAWNQWAAFSYASITDPRVMHLGTTGLAVLVNTRTFAYQITGLAEVRSTNGAGRRFMHEAKDDPNTSHYMVSP